MRYDAAKERWMPMEIRGVRGYFNDLRIDRGTVPEGRGHHGSGAPFLGLRQGEEGAGRLLYAEVGMKV